MILGIDVGGTHTDAVLVQDLQVISKTKVLTNQTNIMSSLLEAAEKLIKGNNINDIHRIVLSTTISTNAIVQDKTNRVAMVLLSGPGLSPETLDLGKDVYFARGYVNHRGIPVKNVNSRQINEISGEIAQNQIRHIGIVGKFSSRNPQQEIDAAELLRDDSRHISLGHTLSGQLNFPRRIATTYLNAAIHDIYKDFVEDVRKFAARIGRSCAMRVRTLFLGSWRRSDRARRLMQVEHRAATIAACLRRSSLLPAVAASSALSPP